jgi:hypothetical protein
VWDDSTVNILEEVRKEYEEIKIQALSLERELDSYYYKYLPAGLNVTDEDITLKGQKGRRTWKSNRLPSRWG